ncbi:MAG: hypothetical protein M1820_003282 [Bogoriella megaspora]|nr:MAG: hypothetical protein M1820_003282 [Bogoriella megaspora]
MPSWCDKDAPAWDNSPWESSFSGCGTWDDTAWPEYEANSYAESCCSSITQDSFDEHLDQVSYSDESATYVAYRTCPKGCQHPSPESRNKEISVGTLDSDSRHQHIWVPRAVWEESRGTIMVRAGDPPPEDDQITEQSDDKKENEPNERLTALEVTFALALLALVTTMTSILQFFAWKGTEWPLIVVLIVHTFLFFMFAVDSDPYLGNESRCYIVDFERDSEDRGSREVTPVGNDWYSGINVSKVKIRTLGKDWPARMFIFFKLSMCVLYLIIAFIFEIRGQNTLVGYGIVAPWYDVFMAAVGYDMQKRSKSCKELGIEEQDV